MGPSRDSPVEAVIRQMRPRTLFTVRGGARFEVDSLAPDAVELLFGGSKTRTVIRWTCLEGIPAFLHEKGWVEIGATHSVTVKPGTLEAYLRTCLRRSTGGYVAALLAEADIIDVDPRKPAKIRLKRSTGHGVTRWIR